MHAACYCRACVPTDVAVVCSVCGQEVRHGTRDGQTGFLHREPVDHAAILGHLMTFEVAAANEKHYREHVYYTDDGTPYTAAEYDIKKDKDVDRRNRRLAELRGEDPDYVEPRPPVEVWAHDVEPDTFAPRSGIRQVLNLIPKQGWDLISCRHARGPYLGADGSVLSISDTHVVKTRGPARLDGGVPWAVASWRDGKFDFAYIGTILGGRTSPTKVDATTMKNWIKGTHDPDASEGDDRQGLSES